MEQVKQNRMEYRYLGNTGLQVSILGYGQNVVQDTPEFHGFFRDVVKICYENGINFFDTAGLYGGGRAEEELGQIFKELDIPRDYIVVCTKIFWDDITQNPKPNQNGLIRRHLLEGAKASLRRMQIDTADIIYCHRYDYFTQIEDVCRSMNQLVENNMCYYWGTSDWQPYQIMEAMAICERHGWVKPISEDQVERDFGLLIDKYKYGMVGWSPLAKGVLTGRYNDQIPQDSKYNNFPMGSFFLDVHRKPEKLEKIKKLGPIAEEYGISQGNLALAWCMRNPDVSSIIVGVSRASQMQQNLEALDFYRNKWTTELTDKIEDVMQTRPEQPIDWKNGKLQAPRL